MLPTAPDYIVNKLAPPDRDGPAHFLTDGRWCGHGEPLFSVYDVREGDISEFAIHRPAPLQKGELRPPAVKLASSQGDRSFLIYDPRRHPASIYALDKFANIEPSSAEPLTCDKCHGKVFRTAVGFEIPSDSNSPNDTSWFALAAICVGCGAGGIVFDDETA
jgi:hypothetical protein